MSVSFAKIIMCFFEFHSSFCLVKSQDAKFVLRKGFVGSDGLYQFPQLPDSMPKCKLPSNVCNSVKASVQSPIVNTITSD